MSYPRFRTRRAFTLVELLVVVVIIALLASLITAAVFKAKSRANEVRNRQEISQLGVAIAAFKTKFGVDYLPSRIWLDNTGNYNAAPPGQPLNITQLNQLGLGADSKQYLLRLWPRLQFPVDWRPINAAGTRGGATSVILEGDQCLVFFLGGVQSAAGGNNCLGFASNPTNPTLAGGNRILPFYDFATDRLQVVSHLSNAPFFSYLDTYRLKPYAYFSPYKSSGDYDRYFKPSPLNFSDCQSLGVWPYAEGVGPRYLNANSFQIISAGSDGAFGAGSNLTVTPLPTWTPASAAVVNPPGSSGADDHGNFHDAPLGSN